MIIEIKDLLDILKKQSEVMENLLDLAESQIEILKINDIEGLKRHTALQEEQGRKLALLERERQVLLANIQKENNVTIEGITDLTQYLSSEDLKALTSISEEILAKHAKLEQAQELNKLLLKQGLSYSKKMFKGIVGEEKEVYGKTGSKETTNHRIMIDKNV